MTPARRNQGATKCGPLLSCLTRVREEQGKNSGDSGDKVYKSPSMSYISRAVAVTTLHKKEW